MTTPRMNSRMSSSDRPPRVVSIDVASAIAFSPNASLNHCLGETPAYTPKGPPWHLQSEPTRPGAQDDGLLEDYPSATLAASNALDTRLGALRRHAATRRSRTINAGTWRSLTWTPLSSLPQNSGSQDL